MNQKINLRAKWKDIPFPTPKSVIDTMSRAPQRPEVGSTDGLYEDRPCQNTDTEIWRERRGDYYADSIHVTESGGIGINCGGHVIVAPVRIWHDAGEMFLCVNPDLPRWKHRLAMWLLGRSSYNATEMSHRQK